MRQRRIKDLDRKIEALSGYIVSHPATHRGSWREVFPRQKDQLYLEIGCGKGQFINRLAEREKDGNFLAVEGQGSVILRALQSCHDMGHENLLFVYGYVKDINDIFSPGELDGIYLNFSDPWPKDKHRKRRLTYRTFLEGYKKVIRPGGCIRLKTDQEGLFDFTLEEMESVGLDITEVSRDLYGSAILADNIPTEYEEKFIRSGKKIFYIKASII